MEEEPYEVNFLFPLLSVRFPEKFMTANFNKFSCTTMVSPKGDTPRKVNKSAFGFFVFAFHQKPWVRATM